MTESGFRRLVLGLLVFNTFLISALAGAGIFYIQQDPPLPVSRLPLAGEQLSGDDKTAFQGALADERRKLRSLGLEARQARIEAASLMGQPDLNKVALADALKRARDAELALRQGVEQRAVDFVANLTLDQRRRLSEGLIEREAPKPPATK
ncbi:periplasmic heavy metal sensor [Rhizobium paknamense]|uniref:Membrane protein n=1 Tax=Rhizobium paknamense TaxID=1206817 RepID=A0ABU0IE08_9HYPH|nr:periplasmic heavy metal sensor [Rhizobium paknamense]MDQ0456401.1 putative membrane protein [Rhizobium paknamense]